jgi:hypothetical protein
MSISVQKGRHFDFRTLTGILKSNIMVRFMFHKAKIVSNVRCDLAASVRQVVERQFNAPYFKKQKNEMLPEHTLYRKQGASGVRVVLEQ